MRILVLIFSIFLSIYSFGGINKKYTLNLGEDISLITWADVDYSGNVYLLDGRNAIFLKIDGSGKIVFNRAKKGQGPGEFQYPSCIQYVKGKGVFSSDILRKKLVLMDSNYKFLKDFPLPLFPLRFVFGEKCILIMSDSLKNNRYSFIVYRLMPDRKKKLKIDGLFKGNEVVIKKGMKVDFDNSSGIFFDANDRYVVFLKQVAYPLMLYYQKLDGVSGELVKIKLPYKPIPLTEKEKKKVIDEALAMAKQLNPSASERDIIAKNKIACNYFSIDGRDNVWLLVSTAEVDTHNLLCFNLDSKKIVERNRIKGFKNPGINVKGKYLVIFEKSMIADPKISLYTIK